MPKTNKDVSFAALLALQEMITEEITESSPVIPSEKVSLNSKLGNIIMQQEANSSAVPLVNDSQVNAAVNVSSAPPQTRTDILAEPIAVIKECNLTCFRECLDLKKFVPFPVIQQCISLRCSCNLDTSVEKLDSLIQMSMAPQVPASSESHSVIADFLFAILLVAFAYSAYLYYNYLLQNNKEYKGNKAGKVHYK